MVHGPSGSTRQAFNSSIFYNGDGNWAWRFTPDVAGTWQWQTICLDDHSLEATGFVTCADSLANGGLVVDETEPRLFRRERRGADGSAAYAYLAGIELDYLAQLGFVNGESGGGCSPGNLTAASCHVPALVATTLERLHAQGINHVLTQVFANYSTWMSSFGNLVIA